MVRGESMEKILEISNLTCKYGEIVSVNNISFCVEKGGFLGIIGPNGAGKSTLLKAITGIVKPEKGNISLYGKDISDIATKSLARKIGMGSEEILTNFDFSCEEIVLMGRTPYLRRFSWEKAEDYTLARAAMEMTGTSDLRGRHINEISSGERQKVILARVLTQQPEVLLLDEPTSHLDISHQTEIFGLLKRLQEDKGLTVLTVLHDINLAALYCDKLMLLTEGRMVTQGCPESVITEENIKSVYKTNVLINKNPRTGSPYIMLLP